MSQLRIRTKGFQEVRLNVVSFMSPVFSATASSQTASSEQHHPVRLQQPSIRFDVQFRSQKEFEEWQTFVRSIQLKLLKGKDPNDVALVTLYWPQRNIVNWQGIIKEAEGGAERFQWAPHTTIEVELTKGFVSLGTTRAFSYATDFDAIYGGLFNTIRDGAPNADALLTVPPGSLSQRAGDVSYSQVNASDQGRINANAPRPSGEAAAGSLGSIVGWLGGGR